MKKTLFSLALFTMSISAFSQQDFFALTGKDAQRIIFNDIRSLDMSLKTSGSILWSDNSISKVLSNQSKTEILEDKKSIHNAQATAMATLAVDQNGSIFFMPLYSSNIYVKDAKSSTITLIENNVVNTSSCNLPTQFTRMTLGTDSNIYALNNSGSQLIRISKTNGNYKVETLGAIKENPSNTKKLSEMQTGFGGDMIADTDHQFYIFSASGNIFKFSLQNLEANFVGTIQGLPENFTLNGAAVDANHNLLIGSAKGGDLYRLNIETLQAEALQSNVNLPIYDLASAYFIKGKKAIVAAIQNDIYPTDVTENFVNISLNNNVKGQIKAEIYDSIGNLVMTKTLINKENNQHRVQLSKVPSGIYVVQVTNENGKIIISKKIRIR